MKNNIHIAHFKDLHKVYSIYCKCHNGMMFRLLHWPFFLFLSTRYFGRKIFVYKDPKIRGFVMVINKTFWDLSVEPEHRNNGIGTSLRIYAEDYILSNFDECFVYTDTNDYYNSVGYIPIKNTKYFGRKVTLMKKLVSLKE